MMLSSARERDALCHVARVLVSDEAIQRAILANTELRAMLRAVNAEHFSVRGGPDATTDDADAAIQARARNGSCVARAHALTRVMHARAA
jgi:hypothetical protein